MEIYYELGDDYFYSSCRKKEKVEPMGPSHPCWGSALEEVESLLQQAGRVYDQTTIELIAVDYNAWDELIREAGTNIERESQRIRSQILIDGISEIRKGAESELRIEKLFGGNTKIA